MILLACAAVIAASVVLSPGDAALALGGYELPPLCLFKNLTGWECWGCGLSRSFTWMGHGQVGAAFAQHKLGPALWGLVLLQVPLRARALWRYRRERRG